LSLEETQEMVKTHLISFPDYKWRIEELFAVKDRVIARISISGTFTGDYYGIPATGNEAQSSAIFIVRIENGKIVEQRKEQDVLNIMEQLGMELKPKEREETDS
jgi:predicted ester cyclase